MKEEYCEKNYKNVYATTEITATAEIGTNLYLAKIAMDIVAKHVKKFKPQHNSISSGQVLHQSYNFEKAKLIVKEMADNLVLDLVSKNLETSQIVLTIDYDVESLTNPEISKLYNGEVDKDRYGRNVPKHAHGTINLKEKTSSTKEILEATTELYDKIVNENLLIRRINITACDVTEYGAKKLKNNFEQLDLFTNYKEKEIQKEKDNIKLEHEHELQKNNY